MMMIQNREELLKGIGAWIDNTLNQSLRSAHGDPDDERTTLIRETARNLSSNISTVSGKF